MVKIISRNELQARLSANPALVLLEALGGGLTWGSALVRI